MTTPVSDIAFTSAVKAQQELKGSRKGYAKMEESGGWNDRIDEDLEGELAVLKSANSTHVVQTEMN